jgi:hypothetical protein
MDAVRRNGRESLGTLIRDLADGGARLVRGELRLARLEVAEVIRGLSLGSAEVATGAILALLGAMAFLAGIIFLAGDQWLGDRYWLAALIVTVILAAIAFWFTRRGTTLLSPQRLVPDETVATLKEDKEWLKRQLTSGATSS